MKLKSILLGATIAGTLTLLTTKYSGKERIEKIKNFSQETNNDIKKISSAFNQTKENIEYTKYLLQTLVPNFKQDLEQDFNEFIFQIQPRLERLQEEIENLNKNLNKIEKN